MLAAQPLMKIKPTLISLGAGALFFLTDVLPTVSNHQFMSFWTLQATWLLVTLLALGYAIGSTIKINQYLANKEKELRPLKRNLLTKLTKQFNKWSFTMTESEVAWLIIKGASFKEISVIRSVASKTNRSHAVAVYRKSGTSNRSEFVALFIDELLNYAPESSFESKYS